MIKIDITKSDNSHYWSENFNDLVAMNAWLSEEKTRSYWEDSFIVMVTDTTDSDEAAAAKSAAEFATIRAKKDVALNILRNAKLNKPNTLVDVISLLDSILDVLI